MSGWLLRRWWKDFLDRNGINNLELDYDREQGLDARRGGGELDEEQEHEDDDDLNLQSRFGP